MNQDFFTALQKMVAETWPGNAAIEVTIKLTSGQKARFPTPAATPIAEPQSFKLSVVKDNFVPGPVQAAILAALDGKAMKSGALGAIVGDKRRLYQKPGGMEELMNSGLVERHERLGYYRPDSPPKELSDE